MDIDKILAPIAPGHPSGENDLEYDPSFIALEEKTKGTPEQEFDGKIIQEAKTPNWQEIRQEAAALLTRTHDLRIMVIFLRALLHTEGLIGLGAGLDLLHGLADRYWDTLFPRLDPAENDDPIQRINILMALCDREAVLGPLLETPLGSSRTMGPCTLRDIQRAAGMQPAASDTDIATLSPEAIDAIFKDSDPDRLLADREAVRRSLALVSGLEEILKAKVGRDQTPRFEDLRRVLEDMGSTLERYTARHRSAVPSIHGKKTAPPPSASPTREPSAPTISSPRAESMDNIRNRQDITRVLHQICLYYEKNEPASPVPLLLKRAAGLVEKNFFEIIQDVAPDSVAQIQKLMGEAKD